MSMMEYYEMAQEQEHQRWTVQWPKENPLLHKSLNVPCVSREGTPDCFTYQVTQKLLAEVVDKTDEVIVQAIIADAERCGFTDLYLLDRQFVLDALREKAEREKQLHRLAKVVRKLTYDLRTNMTSVTRYVRHRKSEWTTDEIYEKRHDEYQKLAEAAVDNILKCVNENEDLRRIEALYREEKTADRAEE